MAGPNNIYTAVNTHETFPTPADGSAPINWTQAGFHDIIDKSFVIDQADAQARALKYSVVPLVRGLIRPYIPHWTGSFRAERPWYTVNYAPERAPQPPVP